MNHISLFTGIGGIDLASEWAGFDTILQVENDPYCLQVLEKHWPDVERCTDIRSLNGRKYRGSVDLVSGGFPCQPYSGAGKRKAFDDDRDLWPEMFRVIQEVRPTFVLGENVVGFTSLGLDRTISNLEDEADYEVQTFNIPACAVGAWHQRARIFVVAYSRRNAEGSKEKPERPSGHTSGCSSRADSRIKENVADSDSDREERSQSEDRQGWGTEQRSEAMADSAGEGSQRHDKQQAEQAGASTRQGPAANVADTNIKGLQRSKEAGNSTEERKEAVQQSPGCSRPKGEFWKSEPNVGRVAHGVQNRVHRLRALGNAVVPQQVYPILEAIAKIHKGEIN